MFKVTLPFLCAIALFSCTKSHVNQFDDSELRKIADLQDHRDSKGLSAYLSQSNANYKRAALIALGSVQDSGTVSQLKFEDPQLNDATAFALGQSRSGKATQILTDYLANSKSYGREVPEALGKVIAPDNVAAIENIHPTDSIGHAGLAWAIYQMGLNGGKDLRLGELERPYLNGSQGYQAQLGAAHFFSRAPVTDISSFETNLIGAASSSHAEVRMAAVSALRKSKSIAAFDAITKALADDDYRVRVNAVRALRNFPLDQSLPHLKSTMSDLNPNVAIAAAELLASLRAGQTLPDEINKWISASDNWRVAAVLATALMPRSADGKNVDVYQFAIKEIQNTTSDYYKAALLTSLGESDDYEYIAKSLLGSEVKVIKTSAASALIYINKRLGSSVSGRFAEIYRQVIADGDAGCIGLVCSALRDSTLGFRKTITDITFMKEALAKLSLPKDYETYLPLARTIAWFEGSAEPEIKNEFNHPIDWTLVATIKSDQKVLIKTSKGDIVMRMLVDEAPGSVANFVSLVKQHYYDGKVFHRVVPNFVVQAGCNRGDGFGSEDYSIRSEFTQRRYTTGSVGMASAGKDTEGTQWFITHSPTPHLDGRYTIFAEVISGMDVVHQIEVGDKILSAALTEN